MDVSINMRICVDRKLSVFIGVWLLSLAILIANTDDIASTGDEAFTI